MWAHTYDLQLSDVLTVQGELAREIAESISARLTPQEQAQLSRAHPMNPEVALLYFKGSYFLSQAGYRPSQGNVHSRRSSWTRTVRSRGRAWPIRSTPWVCMGRLRRRSPRPKTPPTKLWKSTVHQAQALMVLGIVSFLYDWNPTQSEAFFRRSIDSTPQLRHGPHALFAVMLAHHGKFEEAIRAD